MKHSPILLIAITALLLTGCSGGANTGAVPGDTEDKRPYDGISAQEMITAVGTEPFWGAKISGGGDDQPGTLLFTTPQNTVGDADGERAAVTRFAGRGGLSFSGTLSTGPFTLVITPGACSDGMSDNSYPFVVTMQYYQDSTLSGCAWTESQPFTDTAAP